MESEEISRSKLKQARLGPVILPHSRRPRWGMRILVLAIVIAAAITGFWLFKRHQASQRTASAAAGQSRAVPVVVAKAQRGDLPIYLTGLGTVTPYNLVTVRSRVGGEVTNVAFDEGQMVGQGDLLVEIDPRQYQVQLSQAEAQFAKDKANLQNAQADLKRYQDAADAVTKQQIDTQAAVVSQADAQTKIDQSQINDAKLQLTYCHITAPFAGRIGLRKVDRGNIIQANDPNGLAVITQLQPISVIFNISQDDIEAVLRKPGGGVGLPVDAYDRGLREKLASGKVAALDNQVDPSSGTLRIKADFDNKDSALFPNQFVNIRLLADTLRNVVVIPSAGVQRGPDGTFAYVVMADQTVEARPIVTGPSEADNTAINQGLEPGETVVIDGVDKLQPGGKVAPHAPVDKSSAKGATTAPGAASPTTEPSSDSPVPDGQAASQRKHRRTTTP